MQPTWQPVLAPPVGHDLAAVAPGPRHVPHAQAAAVPGQHARATRAESHAGRGNHLVDGVVRAVAAPHAARHSVPQPHGVRLHRRQDFTLSSFDRRPRPRHERQRGDGLSMPQGAERGAPATWTQRRRTLALTQAFPGTRHSRTPFRPHTRAAPAPHCLQAPRRCCRHARCARRQPRRTLPGRAARARRPAGQTLAACAARQALANQAPLRRRWWQRADSEAHQQSSLAVSRHAPSGDHFTPAQHMHKAQGATAGCAHASFEFQQHLS